MVRFMQSNKTFLHMNSRTCLSVEGSSAGKVSASTSKSRLGSGGGFNCLTFLVTVDIRISPSPGCCIFLDSDARPHTRAHQLTGHSRHQRVRRLPPAGAEEARRDRPLMLDVLDEQLAKLLSLGLQVRFVLNGGACYQRNALFDDYGRRCDSRLSTLTAVRARITG
jgi:hypothetical protein